MGSLFLLNLTIILFGLIVGSFLNVVIHRLPLDQSIVRPGSHCPQCQRSVRAIENIPLLSYVALGGKCAGCKAKISLRYPLVEFLTGFLFWVSWMGVDLSDWMTWIAQIRVWTFIALGVAITFIDLDHRIIPDELSLGGMAFGLLTCFADFRLEWWQPLLGAGIGFGAFFGFALLYERLTGREGLGGGDIKYMGTIGAFLGLGGVWSSILISSIVGSVVGLSLGALQKRRGESVLKMTIPYGPFLVLGSLIELFFEVSKWIQSG